MVRCLLLFVVSSVGHVEVVKLLVSRSADKSCKDKQGYSPLHAAAASGHIEIVKYLLRMGTEVSDKLCKYVFNLAQLLVPILLLSQNVVVWTS